METYSWDVHVFFCNAVLDSLDKYSIWVGLGAMMCDTVFLTSSGGCRLCSWRLTSSHPSVRAVSLAIEARTPQPLGLARKGRGELDVCPSTAGFVQALCRVTASVRCAVCWVAAEREAVPKALPCIISAPTLLWRQSLSRETSHFRRGIWFLCVVQQQDHRPCAPCITAISATMKDKQRTRSRCAECERTYTFTHEVSVRPCVGKQ